MSKSTHDPLCPITKPCCGGDEQHPDSTQWCSDCGSTCVCDLLAKADQRGATRALDKARNAVAALIHNNMCDCESCWWKADALDAVNALRHP